MKAATSRSIFRAITRQGAHYLLLIDGASSGCVSRFISHRAGGLLLVIGAGFTDACTENKYAESDKRYEMSSRGRSVNDAD